MEFEKKNVMNVVQDRKVNEFVQLVQGRCPSRSTMLSLLSYHGMCRR